MDNKMIWVFGLLLIPILIGSFMFVSDSVGLYTGEADSQDEEPTATISAVPGGLQSVLFVANAEDDLGIKSIFIYVDGLEVKRCEYSLVLRASCEHSISGFLPGTHSFKAVVEDQSHSVATSDKIFAI